MEKKKEKNGKVREMRNKREDSREKLFLEFQADWNEAAADIYLSLSRLSETEKNRRRDFEGREEKERERFRGDFVKVASARDISPLHASARRSNLRLPPRLSGATHITVDTGGETGQLCRSVCLGGVSFEIPAGTCVILYAGRRSMFHFRLSAYRSGSGTAGLAATVAALTTSSFSPPLWRFLSFVDSRGPAPPSSGESATSSSGSAR